MKVWLPGLVEISLSAEPTDFTNDTATKAIRLWCLAQMFPDVPAKDLIGIVTGELRLEYSSDGQAATIVNN